MMRVYLTALLLILSSPSWAGWRSVEWGMTLEEVITSGEGKITPFTDPKKNIGDAVVLAKQPYMASNIMFDAYFHFKDGKLEIVVLRPQNKAIYLTLEKILTETYGPPAGTTAMNIGCKLKIVSWRDSSKSNTVNYNELSCSGEMPEASIQYRSLREPGKSGL
jgi:hypothetical protein